VKSPVFFGYALLRKFPGDNSAPLQTFLALEFPPRRTGTPLN
jgi:hypothetical protein